MKPIIKSLVFIALAIFATSCERPKTIEESLVGKWKYTIEIAFTGTNYNTGLSISKSENFSGTFTWDDYLDGYLEGDLEDSFIDGYIHDDYLELYEEVQLGLLHGFSWSKDNVEYEAYCDWEFVPIKYKQKEFRVTEGKLSWVEVTYPDGSKIFCTNVKATLEARKK